MSRLAPLLVAAALAMLSTVAAADPKTASALYAEGQTAYQAQSYAAAAAKFVAAYEADPDPVYLFNAAQAFRLGNDCVRASDYYRRFLDKVPSPPNAVKIRGWASDMNACAKAKLAADSPPPAPPTVREPPPAITPDGPGAAPIAPIAPIAPAGHRSRGKLIGAAVSGGLGVILVGVGAYYAKQAKDAENQHDAVCPASSCTWDPTKDAALAAADKRGHRANTLEVTGLAVGAVGIGAAIALFVWARGGESEPPVAVVPTSGGGVLATEFRF